MSKDTPQYQELVEWLNKKKFGQFADKLFDCGVESLNDLRILESEEEVTELAGPQGINMGVVFRRKFIKAVTALRQEGPPPEAPKQTVEAKTPEPAKSPGGGSSSKKGLTRPEQEALNRLVTTIKDHTTKLRRTRTDLASVKKQAESTRVRLGEIFDKAMAGLVMRRKTLEAALDRAEDQTSREMKQRVQDLQTSAKDLLRCKQAIEEQFKSQESGLQRESYVQETVQKALNNVPSDHELRDLIVFEEGEPSLQDFIDNYGTIGAGRAKSPDEN